MDLKELNNGIDQDKHWYYQSKKVPLNRYFKKLAKAQGKPLTLIDFGAGSGFFSRQLLKEYPDLVKQVLLVDIGYTEQEMAETKGQIIEKLHYIPQGVEDAVIIKMDVLEHIEDDYAILADITSRVKRNVHFFITVPAFMSLWSGHDLYMEHYRRYTLPDLRKLLDSQQFQITSHYYIYGWIFPLVWLVRRFNKADKDKLPEQSDMKPSPAPVNALLLGINLVEMAVCKLNRLFGVTCVSEGKIK